MVRELAKKDRNKKSIEKSLTYSSSDVGSRVTVYQARLADWYEGTIIAVYDPCRAIKKSSGIPSSIGLLANGLKTCVHCVKYDHLSGYQWHDLKTKKHRVLDSNSSQDKLSSDLIKIRHQALSSSSSSLKRGGVGKESAKTKASISAACKAYGRSGSRSGSRHRVNVKEREHGWKGRAGGSDYVAPDDRGGSRKNKK